MSAFRHLSLIGLTLLLGGCSTIDYYAQLSKGQLQLLSARQPIERLLDDPATPEALRERLTLVLQARTYASEVLALPDNDSYRSYADIQRPFVVWNLFATDEFSTAPQQSCFPIAGCVAYRGYYQQSRARGAAALLQRQGADTYIAGVGAYSTLGWFDDPVLSSMLAWDDQRLIAVIFHELAHQRLYVADDTAFNESFASFVERRGLQQWLEHNGQAVRIHDERQREAFIRLVLAARGQLAELYASDLPTERMRIAKQAVFEQLRQDYHALRDRQWQGKGPYDQWINGPLNNAKLLPFGLYEQWLPAFAEVFERTGQNWSRFYSEVENIARLPSAQRQQALQALLVSAQDD